MLMSSMCTCGCTHVRMHVQYVLVLNVIHSECECPQTCGVRGVDLKLMMFETLLLIPCTTFHTHVHTYVCDFIIYTNVI